MTKDELFELKIDVPEEKVFSEIKSKWDGISKPLDSLGDFEDIVCKIGAIQGSVKPSLEKKTLIVMCADNGIVEEGVSQSGSEITRAVAAALGKGISSASTMAKKVGARVMAVDIGIDCDDIIPGVLGHKIRRGTENFMNGPALSEAEALEAIFVGVDLVKDLSERGVDMIAIGEMGIGNTTTSAAVLCALLELDPSDVAGRGAGLSHEGLFRKILVIRKALMKYSFLQADARERALEILRTLGGLDIAGLAGVCIGCAIYHVPVVLDGIISTCAALVADSLVPGCRDYMIASHSGREKGNLFALNELGLKPLINGNLALGEGTGALMLFPLLEVALDFYDNAASFADYEIDEYKRFD
jgi:nicotinate-nucleotide--dimethylbenzimidazole phosphoribosyltransferase